MTKKGGSLSANSNLSVHSSYYYYGLLFLGIILLLLLFIFIGKTLYYRGDRANPTLTPPHSTKPSTIPTTKPSTTPSTTPTTKLSSTSTSSSTMTTSSLQSMIKPNVLPLDSITPKPTLNSNNPLNIDAQVLAIVRGRLIDLGDNYNKLTEDDKKVVGACYSNPNGCQF